MKKLIKLFAVCSVVLAAVSVAGLCAADGADAGAGSARRRDLRRAGYRFLRLDLSGGIYLGYRYNLFRCQI